MPTLERDRVVAAYRSRTGVLADAVMLDLVGAWRALNPTRLDATFDGWLALARDVYEKRGAQSQVLARSYYEALRIASRVTAPLPQVGPAPLVARRFSTDMKIKVLIGVKDAMTAGRGVDDAMRAAFVTSTGRAVKHVLDTGRDEVLSLGQADPTSDRWGRVTSGGCDFCLMLADRGAVYYGDTVDFAAHDHCRCVGVPLFGEGAKAAREYAGATRQRSDAEREQLRDYLQANYAA